MSAAPSRPGLLESTAVPLALADVPAPGQAALGVDVPHQDEDEWCWCAVTVGIASFYDQAYDRTQCLTAARVLGVADACDRPDADDVDIPFDLDKALGAVDHFDHLSPTPLAFDAVTAAIDAGRPVCARVRFDDGNGHFVVIRGYRRDPEPTLSVDDPFADPSEPSYDTFVSQYQGSGVWMQSYLTR